jgi:hypothetical protein
MCTQRMRTGHVAYDLPPCFLRHDTVRIHSCKSTDIHLSTVTVSYAPVPTYRDACVGHLLTGVWHRPATCIEVSVMPATSCPGVAGPKHCVPRPRPSHRLSPTAGDEPVAQSALSRTPPVPSPFRAETVRESTHRPPAHRPPSHAPRCTPSPRQSYSSAGRSRIPEG